MIDIAELAKTSGVAASALRHYEESGLLHSVGRRGLRRLFPADSMQRLALIALGQQAGFSLLEIKELLAQGTSAIDREKLTQQAHKLEGTARLLLALSAIIRHTAECPAENHLACPTFQKMLRLATRKSKLHKTGFHAK